jgi:hypothetical protein
MATPQPLEIPGAREWREAILITRDAIAKRDKAIRAAAGRNIDALTIAHAFGITRARVYQILAGPFVPA